MKALVVGYGSIGRRHAKILQRSLGLKVDLVTKQSPSGHDSFRSLDTVGAINNYDYMVIATETYKHRDQLRYLEEAVTGKKILVEKPLYVSLDDSLAVSRNRVYVGYNLRFKTVMTKTRELISDSRVLFSAVHVGQFLPAWRTGTDYRQSYSADIHKGGGALRDLSHELDYIQWLFGKIIAFKGYNRKISTLDITSDDIVTGVFETDRGVLVNVTMEYISKRPVRKLTIHVDDATLDVDVIGGSIRCTGSEGREYHYTLAEDIDASYEAMHRSVLGSDRSNTACSYEEGISVMEAIQLVHSEDPFGV